MTCHSVLRNLTKLVEYGTDIHAYMYLSTRSYCVQRITCYNQGPTTYSRYK